MNEDARALLAIAIDCALLAMLNEQMLIPTLIQNLSYVYLSFYFYYYYFYFVYDVINAIANIRVYWKSF